MEAYIPSYFQIRYTRNEVQQRLAISTTKQKAKLRAWPFVDQLCKLRAGFNELLGAPANAAPARVSEAAVALWLQSDGCARA